MNTRKGLIILLMVVMALAAACTSNNETGGANTENNEENESASNDTGESTAKDPIKIGLLASTTGALETYGEQTIRGFELGLEYATDGTNKVEGHPIELIIEDTETKPDVAVQKATKLLEEDDVDLLAGATSSGDTIAVLPLAKEYETVMVVEPAVADSITGKNWNEYIFRTARSSSQDAIAGASAIADEGVEIATLAPDYSFGRDGVAAFKQAAQRLGATIVLEEYADPSAADFTPNLQKIIQAKPDYLFVIWSGSNTPWNQIGDMKLEEQGIKVSTGAPNIAALKTMQGVTGMEGFSVYYHALPDNPVNDWLVEEHTARYDEVPDLFTPGGMSAAISMVEALKKTSGETNADQLISTMEGMEFQTPKGKMTFRAQDHQALQTMYAIRLEDKEGVDHPVPVLMRKLSPKATEPPVRN